MRKRVMLEKRVGQTPLQAIEAWKDAHPAYRDVSATYAGRLDPMASGKLLVLLGDECRKKDAVTTLDKEYEIEVLLDIGTDTGDVLGMPVLIARETHPSRTRLLPVLAHERGSYERAYPAFSSKTVAGKPLFQYALEGALGTIALPTHEETIYRIRLKRMRTLASSALAARVHALLALVPVRDEPSKALGADFRIKAIGPAWDAVLAEARDRTFAVLTLRVSCASGTYMRSLAERIGQALGTRAFALSIRRTRIGRSFLFRLAAPLQKP